jgi:cell division protein YceG involved in septum cleavage
MSNGEVVQRKFTIVEGRNFRELRAELQANTQLGTRSARCPTPS